MDEGPKEAVRRRRWLSQILLDTKLLAILVGFVALVPQIGNWLIERDRQRFERAQFERTLWQGGLDGGIRPELLDLRLKYVEKVIAAPSTDPMRTELLKFLAVDFSDRALNAWARGQLLRLSGETDEAEQLEHDRCLDSCGAHRRDFLVEPASATEHVKQVVAKCGDICRRLRSAP